MGPGGKGSNQAVAAQRSGSQSTFAGAIGIDAFGKEAKYFLSHEGIQSCLIERDMVPTGTAAIMVDKTGQNAIVVGSGANATLLPEDISEDLLKSADLIIFQLEIPLDTVLSLAQKAKQMGKATFLNPAPMSNTFPHSALAFFDIIAPNEIEFYQLIAILFPDLHLPDLEDLLQNLPFLNNLCRRLQIPIVIITLGSKGAFISTNDRFEFIPAFKVPVVDTTGAGDTFIGAFATALAKNPSEVFKAAHFACAASALCVTKQGAASSCPTAAAIYNFLESHQQEV